MKHPARQDKPSWLRVKAATDHDMAAVRERLSAHSLHTVCEAALCPNMEKCWKSGHATVMILGDRCTRGCPFCGVSACQPLPPDPSEPRRVAESISGVGLNEVVITSVTRDDLPDGGARIWAETIRSIRQAAPGVSLEALIPDFNGNRHAIEAVIRAAPDVFGHNLETIPRLYREIRTGADWQRSLEALRLASAAGLLTKTSFMAGLGETEDELYEAFQAARHAGVRILFLGQYLRPSEKHYPVSRYVAPQDFIRMEKTAEAMGFDVCVFGPLVRSSMPDRRQSRLVARNRSRPDRPPASCGNAGFR